MMKTWIKGAMILIGLVASQAQAQHCGDLISRNTILSRDLVDCPDTGLLVIESGVTIALNGHTIDGTGHSSGIGVVSGLYKVRILGPGTIRQFAAGVALNDGQLHQVSNLTLDDNDTAIYALEISD